MTKRKKIIVISVAAALLVLAGTGIFAVLISPQTFSDLEFEGKVKRAAEKTGIVDMDQLTDFEWDTMYYSWDGYFSESSIKGYAEDTNHVIRDTNYELYNQLLFVKDGMLVRQIIVSPMLDIGPYRQKTGEGKTIGLAEFAREEAIFKAERKEKNIILYAMD